MKRVLSGLFAGWLLLALLNTGAAEPLPAILNVHFAGSHLIGTDPLSAGPAEIFNCPEAQALTRQTLDKLAAFPRTWLANTLPAGTGDGAALVRPLLDDLVTSEWRMRLTASFGPKPDFLLAVRLDSGREAVWKQNLSSLLSLWGAGQPQIIGHGLMWTLPASGMKVGLELEQGWSVLYTGTKPPVMDHQLLAPEPAGTWITVDADSQLVSRLWPEWTLKDLPGVHLEVRGHGQDMLIHGRAEFAGATPSALPEWRLPLKAIHSPFVSFTAARGFSRWLQEQPWYPTVAIEPTPDELFTWCLPVNPFQSYVAIPVDSPENAWTQWTSRWQAALAKWNGEKKFLLPLTVSPNPQRHESKLNGLPPITLPFWQAWQEPAGGFLLAGLFMNSPKSTAFPADLLAQLNQPNTVFFHWEFTSQRMPEFLEACQLSLVVTKHKQLSASSAASKWLNRIGPTLKNSITSAKIVQPGQLDFTRTSQAGLTASELYLLANWLEATNFPGCDLRLPPQTLPKFRHPHPPGGTPPGAPGMAPPLPTPH